MLNNACRSAVALIWIFYTTSCVEVANAGRSQITFATSEDGLPGWVKEAGARSEPEGKRVF